MSNDTPSWSGDDTGATPPPPPPPPGEAPATAAYGGLGKRFGARIIDGLIVAIPVAIILVVLLGVDPYGIVYAVLASAAGLAYFVLLESSQGSTFGKRMLGMSVASEAGSNVTPEQSFKRNWWMLLSIIPFGIGALASLGVAIYIAVTISSDGRNQGFHDKMADSLVLDR